MKKKNLKIIYSIILFLVIVVSYFIGFIFTNFQILKNSNENNILKILETENVKIEDNQIIIEKGQSKIYYELENCGYINEFTFNYDSDLFYYWELEVYGQNGYEIPTYSKSEGYGSSKINIYSEKINSKVCKISLAFDTQEEIAISNVKIDNDLIYISKVIIGFVILALAFYNFIIFRKWISSKPERLFLYVVLVLGISIMLLLPFGLAKSWDDEFHFIQAYGIVNKNHTESSKEFISTNNRWERFNTEKENNAYIKYLNEHNYKIDEPTNIKIGFKSISYVPYALGFLIGNLFHLNFYLCVNLAILLNLAVYALLVYYAIKNTPVAKRLMLCIGLLPTSLFMAGNFTYDITLTASILLGFSFFLKELFSKNKINIKNIIIIILSFMFGAVAKQIYIPFVLIIFLFNKDKFSTPKMKTLIKTASIITTIMMLFTFVLPMLIGGVNTDPRGGNTNGNSQLKLVLKHPITTTMVYKENMLDQFMTKLFGIETLSCNIWMVTRFVYNAYYIYFIILIFCTILENENKNYELNKKQKLLIIAISLVIMVAIWGSMFLSYTEVGQTEIAGVQGRYFIPLLFPLLLCLSTNKIQYKLNEEKMNYTISLILLLIIYYSLFKCII